MTQTQQALDATLVRLVNLIDDLVALIGEENRELETGVPGAASSATALKARLGNELEAWVGQVRAGEIDLGIASPHLRLKLTQRAEVLDQAMQENMVRLRAGIDATRRRVDAIMRAIREQAVTKHGYDATGRRAQSAIIPTGLLA